MTSRSNPSATPQQSGRPVLQRREQARVSGGVVRPAKVPPPGTIGIETPALLGRIGQFVIAVGQFDPIQVDLEALGDARIAGIQPRQGRLLGGIAVRPPPGPARPARARRRSDEDQVQPPGCDRRRGR